MALETGTYVDDLVITNPVGATDAKSFGDDHIRLVKSVLKTTFPNFNFAVTAAGRALLDDADAAAQRTTLGLGALAVLAVVDTAEITDAAVTNAKLADMVQATVKGRQAGGGTGVPEDLTAAQARTALALGTAAVANIGTSGDNVPKLNVQNVWSTNQTIDRSGTLATFNIRSDLSAGVVAQLELEGHDAGGNDTVYGSLRAAVDDATEGTEDGHLDVRTTVDGSLGTRVKIGQGTFSNSATGGDKGLDTANYKELYDDGDRIEVSVLDTKQSTTSGTAKTFTKPSTFSVVTKIEVMLLGCGLDGATDEIIVQLGDAGGIETGSYVGGVSALNAHVAFVGDGFMLETAGDAAYVLRGTLNLTLCDAPNDTWMVEGAMDSGTTEFFTIAGLKSLTAALTQVRLTRSGSTDAFDAGGVNVRWTGY